MADGAGSATSLIPEAFERRAAALAFALGGGGVGDAPGWSLRQEAPFQAGRSVAPGDYSSEEDEESEEQDAALQPPGVLAHSPGNLTCPACLPLPLPSCQPPEKALPPCLTAMRPSCGLPPCCCCRAWGRQRRGGAV